jgi:pimeloyl-ACP methyl ester carboxylesterase
MRWIPLLVLLLLPYGKAEAAHKVAHCQPLPADVAFPSDFPALQDQEWGFRLGGWGGVARGRPLRRYPVIFIHGNTRDASDWDEPGRSVRKRFREAGYSPQELWALSYNGKSTKDRLPGAQCMTDNRTNIPDLAAFVKAVLAYTGAPKVDLVAHSLGVTIARGMLAQHPELARIVEDFVAIAGPNHGTTVCRRLWLVWIIGWRDHMGCDELVPGSEWLQSLNGPDGEKEAPGPTRVLAVYDGTGADILYLRWLLGWPVRDQDSPALKGAHTVKLPGLTHDELRISDDAVSAYLRFVK